MWYANQEMNKHLKTQICFSFPTAALRMNTKVWLGTFKNTKWTKPSVAQLLFQPHLTSSLGWTAFGSGGPTGFGELRKAKMEPTGRAGKGAGY